MHNCSEFNLLCVLSHAWRIQQSEYEVSAESNFADDMKQSTETIRAVQSFF